MTCGCLQEPDSIQAGHFVRRVHNILRFDHRNVAPQCPSCNVFRGGEQYRFSKYIDREWGEGTADELFKLSRQTKQFTADELISMIMLWEHELEGLGYGIDTTDKEETA